MGKLQPTLRFPEFKGDWISKELKDLSSRIGDGLHGTPIYVESSEFIFINGNNLIDGKINISSNSKKVDFKTFTKNDKNLNDKSLLISLNGTIGSVAKYNYEKVMLSKSVGYINFLENSELYFHLLRTEKIQKYFEAELTGSTIKNLSLKTLRETKINVPKSNSEQIKIATFLSAVDEKLNLLKEKKQALEDYKKGMMQKIFSQEIRFKDDNGKEFEDWEEKTLGELMIENKSRNKETKFNEVFSVAKSKGVINQIEHLGRSYASENISNYKVVFPFDIVYTKSPTSDFPYGIIKQNLLNRIGVVSVLYGVFTPINKNVGFIIHNYFENWKNTYNYLDPIVQKGAKNTINIGNNIFLNGSEIYFPINEKEQTKIANFLSAIDKKITLVSEQIEAITEYKKGLLQQLFC